MPKAPSRTTPVRPPRQPSRFAQRLRVSDGFRAFALDQLERAGGVTPRSMFGGIGLYRDDLFFGILAADTLYLKADPQNRARFERAGSHAFTPSAARRSSVHYFSVPIAVLEDADEISIWVAEAIDAAARRRDAPTAPTTSSRRRLPPGGRRG